MTEQAMLQRLYQTYQRLKMVNAVIPHVPLGLSGGEVGFWQARLDGGSETIRYIDALILQRSKRWAVEIKVSKGDLARELAIPEKSSAWRAHAHSFYIFVPEELIEHALTVVPRIFAGIMSTKHGASVVRRSIINTVPRDIPDDTWRRVARQYGKLALGGAA